MIWQLTSPEISATALAESIRADLLDVSPALAFQPGWLAEMAETIALYATSHYPSGTIPLDIYGLLIVRALQAIGDPAAIARARQKFRPGDPSGHPPPLPALEARLHPFRQAGLLRTGIWSSLGPGTGCILNLNRLETGPLNALDLALFSAIRRIIEQLLPVWRETDGAGWLAIEGIEAHITTLTPNPRKAVRIKHELLDYVRTILHNAARRRNWKHVPELKTLAL